MQERLQHKLRARLRVLRPLDPVLRVLPEEILERGQQLAHVEAAIGIDVPGRLRPRHRLLKYPREFPGKHFAVDGVGDAKRRVRRDQSEIAHVLEVPVGIRRVPLGDGTVARAQGPVREAHLPRERVQCWYAGAIVAVRAKYASTVDEAERDALEGVLAGCDSTEMVLTAEDHRSPIESPGTTGW